MNKTAIIYSKEEALAMEPQNRPMNYRVPSKIYHDAFEFAGSASMCWKPIPSGVFSSEEAEKFTIDFLFKVAAELEKGGLKYENWPKAWKEPT
jgi:hypothetical protein